MKTSLISSKCESLTKERMEELVDWVSREVNTAYTLRDVGFQMIQQGEHLEDSMTKRIFIIVKRDNNLSSSRSELRFISINLFEQVLGYTHDHDILKLKHNDLIYGSVSSTVVQEKHKEYFPVLHFFFILFSAQAS